MSLVHEDNLNLAAEADAAKSHLNRHRLFVGGLEVSRAQRPMNFNRGADDCVSDPVQFRIRFHVFVYKTLLIHIGPLADRRRDFELASVPLCLCGSSFFAVTAALP